MAELLKREKRILYIHGEANIGGAERELLTWLKYLDRERFLPFVVCPDQGPLVAELDHLHVPHVFISLPAWRKFFHIFWRPFAIVRLVRVIRQWHIDIVHVNDYWWAPLGIVSGWFTGRPCVVHVRQEIEPRKVSQYWLNKGNVIIPVSYSIGEVMRSAGACSENLQVVQSGIAFRKDPSSSSSHETLSILSEIKGPPVIGTVANLFPRKGLQYLVEAVGQLRPSFPQIFLVIVGAGDDEYEGQLRTQVSHLELTSHVLFTGYQEQPEIFLAQFDVFVLSSVVEGLGIVLLEAMALGKPIVASRVGGIPEVVEHGKTGLLVNPADVGDLCRGLFTVLQDPEMGLQMGKNAKKRVAEYFSVERMMEQLYEIYEGAGQ
ncbi:MAG: glycosyltransferase family 4 protein [Nitrospirota bacterium]|nr:glycosyltransferase family 4 protein [Nitrospirota bacterium]MDH5586201.1 glycosyltransferase family 4 protein [Nitrospirota bacterium]MDH5773840.1 glycosyltransferase family 4 protein [Nitrospirota bacterium]